ncbi:glycosyltransferase family 2 protein, partial [Vibrio sp. F13]
GISHFDALWDNVKISWMHTRLFFGMLPRAPKLIARHFKSDSAKSGQKQDSLAESNKNESEQPHWSRTQERGTVLGIKLLLAVYT